MLVAVNAGDGKTVLHWSFEDEPTAVGDALEDVYARPLNIASRQGIAAHLVSTKPTVSSEVYRPTRQSVCQGGETLAPNLRSAYFYGYSETYAQSWAGSFIYSKQRGTQPDFRTADFTFELFLRCDLTARQDSVDGQTLGGYGAAGTDKKDPDWYVALAADSPHNVTLVYTDNEGTKHSRDMGFCLGDGKWHHFAVTYAAAAREAVAYLDYAEKARLTLETDMRLSTNETFRYDFGRNLGSSGFTGWMDDIRISRCVRPVSEFLRKGPPHGLIMIFR